MFKEKYDYTLMKESDELGDTDTQEWLGKYFHPSDYIFIDSVSRLC